jgi:hypothetical protein
MLETSLGNTKYEKLESLTQLPPTVTDDVAMAFIQNFYLNFPPTKDEHGEIIENEFLSFKTANTSEESNIEKRVVVHDIIDHIGVGRMLNEFDAVGYLEPISKIKNHVSATFDKLANYMKDISPLVDEWKASDQKIDLKMYVLRNRDKDKDKDSPMNLYVKSVWDEMTQDQILKLIQDEKRYRDALSIYGPDLEILRGKYNSRTDEEMKVYKELNEFDKINDSLWANDRENLFANLVPKIERRHVLEFLIRLNMLEWTEEWIDSILEAKDANLPKISEKILEENGELNTLFRDHPEYFDLIEGGQEYADLTFKNKEVYARVQKKVLRLLNRIAPTEAKRYILLKNIEKQAHIEKNKELN